MSIIRNDRQVALNDLLVAVEKSADHYQASADSLQDHAPAVSRQLRELAGRRERLADVIKREIQASGDLPSAPDEDRESVEQLFQRVHASLAPDQILDVLRQRLDAEDALADLLSRIRDSEVGEGMDELLQKASAQVRSAQTQLRRSIFGSAD